MPDYKVKIKVKPMTHVLFIEAEDETEAYEYAYQSWLNGELMTPEQEISIKVKKDN